MKRTQVQLPDPLHAEVRRVAALQDWSIAEVLRRGAEYIVGRYPAEKKKASEWEPPAPVHLGLFRAPPEDWRALADDPADQLTDDPAGPAEAGR